jgi:hypothetical protein
MRSPQGTKMFPRYDHFEFRMTIVWLTRHAPSLVRKGPDDKKLDSVHYSVYYRGYDTALNCRRSSLSSTPL